MSWSDIAIRHLSPLLLQYIDTLGNKHVYAHPCPAGWGLVIVENDKIVFERSGSVVIDTQSADFIGAQVGESQVTIRFAL